MNEALTVLIWVIAIAIGVSVILSLFWFIFVARKMNAHSKRFDKMWNDHDDLWKGRGF